MRIAPGHVPVPEDFADPDAVPLDAFIEAGQTICFAAEKAVSALASSSEAGVGAVQFYFNGPPAVARVGDDADAVFLDWLQRRQSYQRAAGILA